MVSLMVLTNAVCLLAVAVLATRLWKPPVARDVRVQFAAVLAGAQAAPIPEAAGPRSQSAPPPAVTPACTPETAERLVAALALSERLAIVRHMLQGKSVEETAAAARVSHAAVRALYRAHGRSEGDVC